jgi:hypothetical protein
MLTDSKARKGMPVWSGCFMYFPDALLAVAEHSRKANEKHNPGEPIHWSRDKSKDHADCVARHLLDIGKNWTEIDPEFGSLHAVALAWRALALAQIAIERQSEVAQRGPQGPSPAPLTKGTRG